MATTNIQMATGGQTSNMGNGQVQQDQAASGGRYPRWDYLLFGIGVCAWHFLFLIVSVGLFSNETDGGAVFFFCGFLPSAITFVWLITDSTVHCCNPRDDAPNKVCCCPGLHWLVMIIPMGVATLLRFILWISLFNLFSSISGDLSDNVFWIVVSLATWDVAPMVLVVIDWYIYYNRQDFEGIFGYKYEPLRVAFAQAIPLFILSWAFILAVGELFEADPDAANAFLWPWILHGVVATAVILITLAGHFGKFVQGNTDKVGWFKYVCWVGGAAVVVMWLIIAIKMFELLTNFNNLAESADNDTDSTTEQAQGVFTFVWVLFMLYYTAITIPGAVGLFNVKNDPHFT